MGGQVDGTPRLLGEHAGHAQPGSSQFHQLVLLWEPHTKTLLSFRALQGGDEMCLGHFVEMAMLLPSS